MQADLPRLLLLPIQETSTCGDELEYDAEYIELQVAASGKGEQQFGTTIIPAQQPNWSDVARRASELLRRTKDLRVLAYLARARAELEGLPGYAEVLQVALYWLETYWEDLYPRILVDDEKDPMLRVNAIASLMEMESIGRVLRHAPLVQGDFGSLSLRDLETHLESDPHTEARVRQTLNGNTTPELNSVRTIHATLLALSQLIEQRLGNTWVLDHSAFAKPFALVARVLIDSPQGGPEQPLTAAPGAQATSKLTMPDDFTPRPERREQAMQLMDSICLYFERHEPGHPAVQLIRRAQRLMPMNFMEIIQDMAPESGQAFQHILGSSAATGGA